MQFTHPKILYFFALLIIPIIVHLFQLQRFVKVPFTNVSFLKKLVLQTRKSSQLKKWLILATRIMGLCAIIFSFSQPYFSTKKTSNKENYFIYLDNSLSLNSKGERGGLFQVAIQEIIKNISDKETYSFATNTNYFDNLSALELKKTLLNTKTTSKESKINEVLLKFESKKQTSTNNLSNTLLISDFQNTYKNFFTNVNTPTSLVKLKNSKKNNLSIDSTYLKEDNIKSIKLNVIIKNQGEGKTNIPIALYNKNKLINKQSFSIEKNSQKTIIFEFQKQNIFNGKLKITYSDTFSFDNTFFFTINSEQKINVLSIGKEADFLSKIYSNNEFNFTSYTTQNINYNNLFKQQLIVLNEIKSIPSSLEPSLISFCEKGGYLVIIPNNKSTISSYSSLLQKLNLGKINQKKEQELKITQIHFDNPFFKNVFSKKITNFQYPETNTFYSSSFKNASKIISYEDGSSFLDVVNLKSSKIFWFSSPLDKTISNFINSPLIVPVFYNFAKLSLQHQKLYYTIESNNSIDVKTKIQKNNILAISNKESSFIPLQQAYQNKTKLFLDKQTLTTGFHQIMSKKDTIKTIAFNYPKEESLLNFLNINELISNKKITNLNSISDFFKENNKKNKVTWLWKWFLTLAIVSLLLEILILKFLKP